MWLTGGLPVRVDVNWTSSLRFETKFQLWCCWELYYVWCSALLELLGCNPLSRASNLHALLRWFTYILFPVPYLLLLGK